MKTKHCNFRNFDFVPTGLRPVSTMLLLIFVFALSPSPSALSQVPQGFNYQAIARDAVSGNPITEPVNIMIAILAGDASTVIYEEEHSSVDPDEHGLFNLVIGQGTWASGDAEFNDIDWTEFPKYIRTSVYYAGGWRVLDPAQLWSVPYAMVADSLGGPLKKLEVEGETEDMEESLFEVRNTDGQIVFAVYNEGVRIYVSDGDVKGPKGGFAIGGFGLVKQEDDHQYFFVSGDSIRAYIDSTSVKGPKGGFAIGGFDYNKGKSQDYMKVTRDSVRIYLDANPATKGPKGGFAIGGFDYTKGDQNFFNVSMDTLGKVDPSENRILWYPLKNAFLTGKVLIESRDSVGENSFSSGFENKAKGKFSQAFGYRSIARGDYSQAMGYQAVAKGFVSLAFGANAVSNGNYAVAIGDRAFASDLGSYAFGEGARAVGYKSYAIGYNTLSTAEKAIAIGSSNTAQEEVAVAIGHSADALGNSSIAIGRNSQASAFHSIAIGVSNDIPETLWTNASGLKSVAIGTTVKTTAAFSYGFGFSLTNNESYSIVTGRYNNPVSGSLFIIGNGTGDETRYNSICLLKDNKMGLSTDNPQSRLELGNIIQTTTLSEIQQNVTFSSVNISSSYSEAGYVPGLIWRTTDNNANKPKAGIWSYNDNTGSKIIMGTTSSYAAGINNTALVIDPTGNIGIGTISPGYKLTVNGTAWCTSGSWSGSDIRWKRNISSLTNILPYVLQLNPVRYEFRTEEFPEMEFISGEQIGLIAQEVEKIFPQLVNTDKEGYKAIAYDKMSSVLVSAIKEQQEQIEAQQAQINQLSSLIIEMRSEIVSLRSQ